MDNRSTTQNYFFIQRLPEGSDMPELVYHTKAEAPEECYYKFLTRPSANKFLREQKKEHPENKYRVVRLRESYFATEWE